MSKFDMKKLELWATGLHGSIQSFAGAEDMRHELQVGLLEQCDVSPAEVSDAMHELWCSPAGRTDTINNVARFVAQLYGPID